MSRSRHYATARLPEGPRAPAPEACAYCCKPMEPKPGKKFCGGKCRNLFYIAERKEAMERFREARPQ